MQAQYPRFGTYTLDPLTGRLGALSTISNIPLFEALTMDLLYEIKLRDTPIHQTFLFNGLTIT